MKQHNSRKDAPASRDATGYGWISAEAQSFVEYDTEVYNYCVFHNILKRTDSGLWSTADRSTVYIQKAGLYALTQMMVYGTLNWRTPPAQTEDICHMAFIEVNGVQVAGSCVKTWSWSVDGHTDQNAYTVEKLAVGAEVKFVTIYNYDYASGVVWREHANVQICTVFLLKEL